MECFIRVGASIVGKIVEYTVEPTSRQLGYLFHYRSNVDELKTQVRAMKNAKDRLQHSVDDATRKLEEVEADVNDWLSRACMIIEEADRFIQNEDQANTRCRSGMFPNMVLRHQLSRKAKKITEEVVKVKNEGRFERVSYHLTLEGIIENNGYEAFETRNLIVAEIMEALKDPIINIIGINGMAGIGKTMLAKEVGRQALEEGLFKVVILITISQNPNFEKIQEEIAEKLNLEIREKTMSIRAKRLQLRLRQEKDILVILDDIWEKYDLQYMGLSFADDQKGCKILMTSRFQDVLCDDMDAKKNFQVGVLSENEALSLFDKIVGDSIKNLHFQTLAIQIVKECAGLPIAISTVAYALKNKNLFNWKDALIQLQRSSPTNIKDMDEKVYKSIRLSYDSLRSEEAQSLFLLCCLHEEDSRISINNLLRYSFGLGLFEHVYTLEETRCRLYTLLNILKSCCLLLEGDEDWYVKMHEVTRDVGILIASEERRMYYIRSDVELEKFLKDKKLKDSNAISLRPYDDINCLPQRLKCKQLLLLILVRKSRSLQIPKCFFEETKSLKVLDLFCSCLKPLPRSFCFLRDLRTLCLGNCTLGDIATIGELKNLEILDVSNSDIEQFPREIGQLTCLRSLDLSYCKKLRVIQSSAISRLKVLEELDMKRTLNIKWEAEGDNVVERNNASIAELKQLTELKSLRLDILDADILPKDLFNDKLNAFEISIGLDNHLPFTRESRYKKFNTSALELRFKQLSLLQENYSLLMLLKRSEVLFLDGLEGVSDNVVSELDTNGFPNLKHLNIKNNATFRYIVDLKGWTQSCSMFQSLESLSLKSIKNLEKIYHGNVTLQSFNRLQVIEVHACHKLRELLCLSTAICLLQLKTIEVFDCKMIEEIVTDDCQGASNGIIFPQLCSLRLCDAPNLLYFYSELKPSERTLPFFNEKLLLSPCFQNLRELCVQQCGPMKYVLSSSIVANLEQLNRLEIRRCEMLEEIVSMDQRTDKLRFPSLKSLQLSQLPKLTRFSTGILLEFPLLNELEMVDCPQLMTFVYNSKSTTRLVDKELKERISDDNLCTNSLSLFNDKLLASNLTKLVVEKCGSLKYLTSSSAAANLGCLNRLEISNCGMMKEIISMDHRIDKFLFPKLDYLHLSNLSNLTRFCTGTVIEFPLLVKLRMVNCPEFSSFVFNSTRTNTLDDTFSATFSLFHDKVAFPSLQIINIRRLDSLKMIWQGQASTSCFRNLIQLYVDECGSLEYLFSSYAAANLMQLNKLKISCCERMEAIIRVDQTMNALIFPTLDYLELSYLPKFTRFCNGINFIEFPFLSELRMEDCPEFMCFAYTSSMSRNLSNNEDQTEMKSKNGQLCSTTLSLLNDKAVFPNLKIINIKRLNRLRTIWQDQLIADSLCKLKVMEVQHCEHLSFILLPNMLSKLHNLRRLFILPCKMLEEVTYDLDLEEFILVGKDGHEEGPCDLYNMLGGKENCKIIFSHVKSLQLQAIPTMMHLFEENTHPSKVFETLEDILVWRCSMLKNLVPSSISLSNLTSLSVSRCHGMVNLLSCSTARSMARLRDMSIDECQMMTEIIGNEKSDADTESEIIFNQLEVLRLNRLSSLTYFHSGNNLMRFPKLKTVDVIECPEMQGFCFVLSPVVGNLSTESFQNLEILFVRRCASLKNLLPLSIFFENLTNLRVEACNGMVSLLSCSVARTLSRLKRLSIIKCQRMIEIISREGCDCDHAESEIIFKQLEILALHKLPRLASFHSGKCTRRFPKLKTVIMMECPEMQSFCFQNLEILDVGVCGKLKNLVPSSISLQNLTALRMSSCNEMVNLLSFSTAKSLAQLKNMSISECQIMTQIIASEQGGHVDGEGEGEVVFDSLEVLELHSLPSLTSFHSGNCVMRFQKLKRVIITWCPEMQGFSYGVIAPNLDKIITRINERYIRAQNCWNIKGYFEDLEQATPMEELWRGDIHSTIQYLWQTKH